MNHNLVPSLYRHPKIADVEELLALERRILDRFKQRSVPFATQRQDDEWEALFFMQHYGVPTRLLDWSESPYIALYFALTEALKINKMKAKNGSPHPPEDAVVWSVQPAQWNKCVFSNINLEAKVLLPKDPPVDSYTPGKPDNIAGMHVYPVCVYGTHNSQRIVAQRGVFLIFGKSKSAMEDIYENHDFRDGILQRYVVRSERVPMLLESLESMAFTDSVVFPDLHGMGLEMKRIYGFD